MKFDNILDELSVRIHGGKIDLKNSDQLKILVEILKENLWPATAIKHFIKNILIISEEDLVKNKKSKNIYPVKSHNPKTQDLIKKDASPKEIEDATKTKSDNIITDNQKKIILKTLSKIENNIDSSDSIYKTKDEKNIVKNFIDDTKKLLDDPTNVEHGKTMAKTYDLSVNKDVPSTEASKLYLGVFKTSKKRKLLGNSITSSIIANALKNVGAISNKGNFIKKSMTPNKIFTDVKTLELKRDKTGVTLGNIQLSKAKSYNYDNVENLFKDKFKTQGLGEEEAKKKSINIRKELVTRVSRHNFILDNIENILGSKNINILNVCDTCDVNTQEGREKTKNITVNKIKDKFTELAGDNLTNNIKLINKSLDELNNTTDKNKYNNKINDIINLISKDSDTKVTAPDVIEVFDYLRVLNNGSAAFLPGDSNFALGDILKLSSKQPTINELLEAENIGSIFTSIEDRSVKKGEGGASATQEKILLTKFKTDDVKDDLINITSNYKSLIHDGNIKDADETIKKLKEKYKETLNNDETYKTSMDKKDLWLENNKNKIHNVEIWDRYYQLGNMMATIYNNNIEFQGYQNSKYIVKKNNVDHDITDGVNRIAFIKFEASIIGHNGKPGNPYPSRFFHSDKK